MLAGPVPLKLVPRREWAGSSLFLDQDAATEYPTLLEKQAIDYIPSTLSVSSRTKKRKLNSSEEASRFSIPPRSQADCSLLSLLSKSRVEHMTTRRSFLQGRPWTWLTRTSSPAYSMTNKENVLGDAYWISSSHPLQRGVLDHIVEGPYLKPFEKTNRKNPEKIFKGLRLTLQNADETNIVLILGDIVHRQGGLIGKNTCVVSCSSPELPVMQLIVKISWPSIHRVSEKTLIDAAKAKADEMAGKGKRHWVLDHLPEILHSQDFHFNEENSP